MFGDSWSYAFFMRGFGCAFFILLFRKGGIYVSENNNKTIEAEASVQNTANNNKKMKACKSCGTMIAKNAKACPSCGAKNKKPIYKRVWFILLVIILIAVIIGIIKGPKEYDFEKPVATVTVDEILQDFQKNATTAGEKYSDNVVAVTGQVSQVLDSYAVIRAYDDDLWLYNVNAYMENSEDLKKFVAGETTTIVGVCDDTTLFGDVDVKQCRFNEKFAVAPDYDKPIKVKAADLVKTYNDNQVAADEQYKYKTLQFTAEVTYVSDDYVVMSPENADSWDFDADMEIRFENKDDFKKAKEGKTYTVVGECYGKADMYVVKLCRTIIK